MTQIGFVGTDKDRAGHYEFKWWFDGNEFQYDVTFITGAQGFYSLNCKTSYRRMSRNREATIYEFRDVGLF